MKKVVLTETNDTEINYKEVHEDHCVVNLFGDKRVSYSFVERGYYSWQTIDCPASWNETSYDGGGTHEYELKRILEMPGNKLIWFESLDEFQSFIFSKLLES